MLSPDYKAKALSESPTFGETSIISWWAKRIALARALLGETPILLLDEVDSNLDHQAVTVVDRILSEYNRTILIVTHRRDL